MSDPSIEVIREAMREAVRQGKVTKNISDKMQKNSTDLGHDMVRLIERYENDLGLPSPLAAMTLAGVIGFVVKHEGPPNVHSRARLAMQLATIIVDAATQPIQEDNEDDNEED